MKFLVALLVSASAFGQGAVISTGNHRKIFSAPGACGNSYLHCRQLTIDHTQVPSTQTNFPAVLIATEADWAVTGSGGDVQHTVTQSGGAAITIPADWILADSTCTTPIGGWEFEAYNSATGALVVHFLVASLSSTADVTSIWVCDDKAAVSTQQMTTTATWDSNYLAVYHLPQTTGAYIDSTSNANNSTAVTITTRGATGKISTGAGATGASDLITLPAIQFDANQTATISGWINSSNWVTGGGHNLWRTDASTSTKAIYVDATGHAQILDLGGTNISGTTVLSASTWYYVVWAFDEMGPTGTLYLNGVSEIASAVGNVFFGTVSTMSICGDAFSQSIGGTCDELRISKIVRSANWITAEYNNQKPSSTFISVGARN